MGIRVDPFSGGILFVPANLEPAPLLIEEGDVFTVLEQNQTLFSLIIDIEGVLELDGVLVEVS